jgi:hypothetical protein
VLELHNPLEHSLFAIQARHALESQTGASPEQSSMPVRHCTHAPATQNGSSALPSKPGHCVSSLHCSAHVPVVESQNGAAASQSAAPEHVSAMH